MRALIAGCGYLGLALGARLAAGGHQVTGMRRPGSDFASLRQSGIEPIAADLTQPESLDAVGSACWDWVVQCAAPGKSTESAYRDLYLDGTTNLLRSLRNHPPRAFVFVGSTSVYGQTDAREVDESCPTEPLDFAGRILVEAEAVLLDASRKGPPAWVLRAAGIYGPGRNRISRVRSGSQPSGVDGQRHMNLIHRDDLASAIVAVLETAPASRVFNVCDGVHPTQDEFHAWLAARLGLPLQSQGHVPDAGRRARSFTHKRVIADRLRKETGWRPAYPDFRIGYEAVIRTHGE